MTQKKFQFKSFDIEEKLGDKKIKLYEIDDNPSNDLDESHLIYVYSTSEENIKHLVNVLNELVEENKELKKLLKI